MQLVEIKTEAEARQLMAKLREMRHFAYDVETNGFEWSQGKEIFALSFSDGVSAWLVYTHDFERSFIKYFLECIFEDPTKSCVGHNIKFDRHFTKASFGVDIRRVCHDTLVKAHLLDENRLNGLKPLTRSLLGVSDKYEEEIHAWLKINCGARENWDFSLVPRELMSVYAGCDTYYTYKLDELLSPDIDRHFSSTYRIDRGVLDILFNMEQSGVRVDIPYLQQIQGEYESEIKALSHNVYTATGFEFNIDSDLELAEVLYGKLKLPISRTTKTGNPSTDAEALSFLEHPVVPHLLEYSDKRHMLSNFILPLQAKADANSRIHGDYSITTTKTGRFACRNPNMQNMPKDLVLRRAFVCDEGSEMWFWDHSQIEMVGFTLYSKDPKMTEALANGTDLHTLVASEALERSIAEISKTDRAMGKGTNFAIIFGVGKAKLARYINGYIADKANHLTGEAAMLFKQKYFYKFPAVQAFQRQVMDTVKTDRQPWGHYVKNKFGRVRRLDPNKAYQGVNHLIQGWAAYLMKSSMIRIQEKFPELRNSWRQNVHDAIRIDLPPNSAELAQEIGHCLTEWPDIPVPVSCTMEVSVTNWAEVEPVKYVSKTV